MAGLILAGVVRIGRLDSLRTAGSNHEVARAVVGALVVLVPLSLVPLALFLWRTTDSSAIVLFPPLLDRRYVVVAYYLVVLGVPLSLLLGARMADSKRAQTPQTSGVSAMKPTTPLQRAGHDRYCS